MGQSIVIIYCMFVQKTIGTYISNSNKYKFIYFGINCKDNIEQEDFVKQFLESFTFFTSFADIEIILYFQMLQMHLKMPKILQNKKATYVIIFWT